MLIGKLRHFTSTRSPFHKTFFDQERFIHFLNSARIFAQSGSNGCQTDSIDGGEQEILADEPPAQHEQRHVEDDDDGADGQARQQVVDDLPQTGEAAHADVVVLGNYLC